MNLQHRTAVITGAGRGLGKAVSLAMAQEGANVVLAARTISELNQVARKIEQLPGEALAVPCDVADVASVDNLMQATARRFKQVDILVNNAAIIGPVRFNGTSGSEGWQHTIDVNLHGAYECCRKALPLMIKPGGQPGGCIINIVSGLGQMHFPVLCAYAVSKAGLIQLTRSLSEELKYRNIRVNAIDPGVMDTMMQDCIRAMGKEKLGAEIHDRFMAFKTEGQLKDPADPARLAAFLASDQARGVTGNIGTIDAYAGMNIGFTPA